MSVPSSLYCVRDTTSMSQQHTHYRVVPFHPETPGCGAQFRGYSCRSASQRALRGAGEASPNGWEGISSQDSPTFLYTLTLTLSIGQTPTPPPRPIHKLLSYEDFFLPSLHASGVPHLYLMPSLHLLETSITESSYMTITCMSPCPDGEFWPASAGTEE